MYEKDIAAQRVINDRHNEIYEAYLEEDFEKAGNLMKMHLDDSMQYALQLFENIKF